MAVVSTHVSDIKDPAQEAYPWRETTLGNSPYSVDVPPSNLFKLKLFNHEVKTSKYYLPLRLETPKIQSETK